MGVIFYLQLEVSGPPFLFWRIFFARNQSFVDETNESLSSIFNSK